MYGKSNDQIINIKYQIIKMEYIPSGLFDLILYVSVNSFSVTLGWVFLSWTSTKQGLMCYAQGYNTMPPVGLKSATPRSRVNHWATALPYAIVKAQSSMRYHSWVHQDWSFFLPQYNGWLNLDKSLVHTDIKVFNLHGMLNLCLHCYQIVKMSLSTQ